MGGVTFALSAGLGSSSEDTNCSSSHSSFSTDIVLGSGPTITVGVLKFYCDQNSRRIRSTVFHRL